MLVSALMRDRSRRFLRSLGSPLLNGKIKHIMAQVSGNTPSCEASYIIRRSRSRESVCARSRG